MAMGVEDCNDFFADLLPGRLGIEVTAIGAYEIAGRLEVTAPLIAGTGFLFAPAVIALADLLCAVGTGEHKGEDESFTTVELKTNFLGSATAGQIVEARATPAHIGRSTHVWDATATNASTDRQIALFRCTQMILRR